MPENRYAKLLDIDEAIENPDYYQVLLLDAQQNITPETVEQQYKLQMSKLQQNRSTKYKDFIEFLKGELKTARRIVGDNQQRSAYDRERKREAEEKLRELIEMFVQISQNLDEIELGEIHRRGRYFNLAKEHVEKIIDTVLNEYGGQRVAATEDAQARAREILAKRAGSLTDTQISYQRAAMAREAAKLRAAADRDRPDAQTPVPPAVPVPTSGTKAGTAGAGKGAKSDKPRSGFSKLIGAFHALVAWTLLLVVVAAVVLYFGRDSFAKSIVGGVPTLERVFDAVNGAGNAADPGTNHNGNDNTAGNDNAAGVDNSPPPETALDKIKRMVADNQIDAARQTSIDSWRTLYSRNAHATVSEREQLAAYYRDVIMPRWLATQATWHWQFEGTESTEFDRLGLCRDYLDFAGAGTFESQGVAGDCLGLLLEAGADRDLEWRFGAPRKLGELIVRGSLRGRKQPLTLGFFCDTPLGLDGRLTVSSRDVSIRIADRNGRVLPETQFTTVFPQTAAFDAFTHFVLRLRLNQPTRELLQVSGRCWPDGHDNEPQRLNVIRTNQEGVKELDILNDAVGRFSLIVPAGGQVLIRSIEMVP